MILSMWEKGYELRDKILSSLADPYYLKPERTCDDVPGARVMDMFGHLSNAALDIIGLVAIGEDLGALSDRQNELREAYNDVLRVGFLTDWLTVLRFALPITRKIPVERSRVVKRSRQTVERFGHVSWPWSLQLMDSASSPRSAASSRISRTAGSRRRRTSGKMCSHC